MTRPRLTPFDSGPLEEIPLARAPLVSVLAQVRWPPVTQFQTGLKELVGKFGHEISEHYPLFNRQQEMQISLTSNGVTSQPAGTIFQFRSADECWQVSLSDSFIALDTKNYVSRSDFAERLRYVLSALTVVVNVPFAARVGFRYVNRVDDEEVYERLGDLVDFAAMGGGAVPLGDHGRLVHSVSEALYRINDVQLLVKSAHLPPSAILDPSIRPSNKQSWTLDIDSSREEKTNFETDNLVDIAVQLADVGYRFFRWATSPEFLKIYGAEG